MCAHAGHAHMELRAGVRCLPQPLHCRFRGRVPSSLNQLTDSSREPLPLSLLLACRCPLLCLALRRCWGSEYRFHVCVAIILPAEHFPSAGLGFSVDDMPGAYFVLCPSLWICFLTPPDWIPARHLHQGLTEVQPRG